MPGPVVRVWQLTELHVHDAARLVQAARASGSLQPGDEDLPDASPQLLAHAAAVILSYPRDEERPQPGQTSSSTSSPPMC
jgi:hypothetical protein